LRRAALHGFSSRQAPLRRVFFFFSFYLNENFSASGNNFQKKHFAPLGRAA